MTKKYASVLRGLMQQSKQERNAEIERLEDELEVSSERLKKLLHSLQRGIKE